MVTSEHGPDKGHGLVLAVGIFAPLDQPHDDPLSTVNREVLAPAKALGPNMSTSDDLTRMLSFQLGDDHIHPGCPHPRALVYSDIGDCNKIFPMPHTAKARFYLDGLNTGNNARRQGAKHRG